MKKLMSIFGVILFAFALTLTSCDSGSEEKETPKATRRIMAFEDFIKEKETTNRTF